MLRKKIIFSLLLLFSSEQLNCISFSNQVLKENWVEGWNTIPSLIKGLLYAEVGIVIGIGILAAIIKLKSSEYIFEWVCNNKLTRIMNFFYLYDQFERAIKNQKVEIVKLLINHPEIDINMIGPLHQAIRMQNLEMVRLLINHPKIIFTTRSLFFQATEDDWLDGVKLLHGQLASNQTNYTELLSSAAHSNATRVFEYLTEQLPTNQDAPFEWQTPLYSAVVQSSINIIEWLSVHKKITDEQLLEKLHTEPCKSKHLNRRNSAGLRLLDITREWYLPTIYNDSNKLTPNKEENVYYKLLKETPAWSCQTLYEVLIKNSSRDAAQNIIEFYLTVVIPKLPSDALKNKIHALKTKSNKTQSTLLLTTK